MRRIGLTTRRTPLFLAMLVMALIVFLPMRLMLGWIGVGDQGMTARAVSGSVWSAALTEARFGEVALGDLTAGVAPLQLLVGRARIDLTGPGDPPAPRIEGAIGVTRHSVGIDDTTSSIPVGRAFAPLPISAIDLADVTVRFTDDQCSQASGRVVATMGGTAAGVPIAPSMSGDARCEGGALLLPLTGRSGAETANLRIWQDGRYRAELTLAAGEPAQAVALQGAGFVQVPEGWRLSIEGTF